MRLTFFALILNLAFYFAVVTADTSDSYDVTGNKTYGNCRVWTQVDMLTDVESHHLKCSQETIADVTEVGIVQWNLDTEGLELRAGKGLMFHLDDRIPVAIRIDKGKVVRGEWEWFGENMVAVLHNQDFITAFIDELARGNRVALQVEGERGNVILDGSAAAVKDFRSRIRQSEAANIPPALPASATAKTTAPTSRNSPQAAERAREAIENLRAQSGTQGTSTSQSQGGVAAGMQELLLRTYEQRVRARITNAWRLPIPEKMAQGLQAIALLTIDREGEVIRYELTRSSGNPSFDASLRRAVQASSPLPRLPNTYPGEILEAEIHFGPPALW